MYNSIFAVIYMLKNAKKRPGRKDEPYPYATLLKLLSQAEVYKNSNECRVGVKILLGFVKD
jgi:hypothetical protein